VLDVFCLSEKGGSALVNGGLQHNYLYNIGKPNNG